ncbi:MAG TPA: 6-phosphogluconolactonase [Thermoanaerobaculia bacterium]|nr:6-phosphogluconolactonase [Thermoanaerobaculia bacterium]
MPPEILVADPGALAAALAARLEREAAAVAAGATLSLALAGGSLATALFPRLARLPLDWSRVAFFWADERAVPPAHADSNYRLARELWLGPAGVPAASVHRMPADAADLEAAAAAYARELAAVAGEPPRLDLALLGVGEEGHVASLFPGHPLLGEERRTVAPVLDAPKPPPRRLTLTMPVLAGAGLVVMAAFGAAKRPAIAAALGDPESPLPVALLLRRARHVLLLLDPAAAP